ncbi:hypothetical protein WJX77_007318 [Trebouxia sp. C0004]
MMKCDATRINIAMQSPLSAKLRGKFVRRQAAAVTSRLQRKTDCLWECAQNIVSVEIQIDLLWDELGHMVAPEGLDGMGYLILRQVELTQHC